MHNIDKLKSIIYAVFSIIVAIIGIEIILVAIGANPDTPFVRFWHDLSGVFTGPWEGIFPNIKLGNNSLILISAGVAAIFYMLFAFALDTSIAHLRTHSTTRQLLYSLVNGIFKLIEFFLIIRFVFKLLDASTRSNFVDFVYEITNILHEPFTGIVRDYVVSGVTIEISTLLILVIVIILDIAFDNLLVSALEDNNQNPRKRKHSA